MNRYHIIFLISLALLLNPVFAQEDQEGMPEMETAEEAPATTNEPGQDQGFGEMGESTTTPGAGSSTGMDGDAQVASDAPKAIVWTDKNGTLFANSKIQFTLSASDALSDVDYVEYKINDGPFIKYSGAFSVQNEGQQTIVYRAVDKAGNKEVDKVFNVVIDNNSPEIRIYPAQAFVVKDGKNYTRTGNFFTFRVTDDYAGIKSVEYSVNSNELKAYNGEVIQLSTAGTQFVRYRSNDNLDNRTGDNTIVIEVDAERPTVQIVPSAALVRVGEKQFARRNTGFEIRGMDSGSGVSQLQIKIDGATEWQSYTDILYFDTEQEHKIEARAVDAVGNESDIKTITFIVDENPPVTKLETSSN